MTKKSGRKNKDSDASFTEELNLPSVGKYPLGLTASTLKNKIDLKIFKIGLANEEAVYCIRLEGFVYPQPHVSVK